QQSSDFVGFLRATRLTRGDNLVAQAAQITRQRLYLRGLAAPLAAFKCNEEPARCHRYTPNNAITILLIARVKNDCCSTSSTATRGKRRSGRPGMDILTIPTSSPALIGATSGELYSAVRLIRFWWK